VDNQNDEMERGAEEYHVLTLTETEALEVCFALMKDFNAMTHTRVTSGSDPKAKTEGIVNHARWVFPLAEALKRTRGGLYQWPASTFAYVKRVMDNLGAVSESLKSRLAEAEGYAFDPEEIYAARNEIAAELRKRRGGGRK